VLSWQDGTTKAANTYEAKMYDAITGVEIAAYTPDMTQAANGTITFKALIPAGLTIGPLYEIRIRQLTRNAVSEIITIMAGHVIIPSTTIAGAA
jgi:hypothetical protein